MRYADYKPTTFDTKGLNLPDRQDWLVAPVGQNRDSRPLEQSNFAAATRILFDGMGEPPICSTVEVHRFNHWACGWFEIILVHPTRRSEVEAMAVRLENYALLDEDDCCERDAEAARYAWAGCSVRERVALLRRCGYAGSVLAARRDYPPHDDNGSIQERLIGS